jgi:ADP-heptose:LPS heptosyltransferase
MPDRILVIKLGALGDFIYALGAMAAIRREHKDAHITLLTTKPFAEMGRSCGYFDEILIDKKPKALDISGWLSLRRTLNRGRYMRVYDLQNNERTDFYARLFSPMPEWVGAGKRATIRNADPDRSKHHAFLGHVATLKLAGINDTDLDPLLWMKSDIAPFDLPAPYVLLVPGSSPQHPEKRWPILSYRSLVARLVRQGFHPVLLGTKDEKDVTGEIARGLPVIDLTGKTALMDIPALARGSAGAIGNDTGPIHMICVTGAPTVVLFCSRKSTIQKHGPQGNRVRALEAEDLTEVSVDAVMDAFSEVSETV